MAVLKASDYLLRDYREPDGRNMNFYVGYYASQRDGATYHSPLNCLPGAGWVMSEPGKITISPEGKSSLRRQPLHHPKRRSQRPAGLLVSGSWPFSCK